MDGRQISDNPQARRTGRSWWCIGAGTVRCARNISISWKATESNCSTSASLWRPCPAIAGPSWRNIWLASTSGILSTMDCDGRTDADAGPLHLSPSFGARDRSSIPRAATVRRQRPAAATGRGHIEQPVRASRVGRPDFRSCLDTREHVPDPTYLPSGPVSRFASRAGSRYGPRWSARSLRGCWAHSPGGGAP